MNDILQRIVAVKHEEVAAARAARPPALLREHLAAAPPVRNFEAALRAKVAAGGAAVIAEVKKASPSKGVLREHFVPAEIAASYERGGAACLSVLTDVDHFGGSVADLRSARSAVSIPVLRKDFTVCAADVLDARIMGADCMLLIAAALDDVELAEFHALGCEVGLDVLVEIHDEAELERAMAVGATLVGVNQRDLVTFQVDHARALRMAEQMPDGVVRVAESGVRGPEDAAALRAAGYHAVLVGESLVTAPDPSAAVRALRSAAR
jgi:indole-3-glycerol phosphate synthase